MRTDFEPPPLQRHVLAPGQTLSLHLAAGSTLHVHRGALLLHEVPQWLGETVLRPAARLGEGQAHVLGAGGWIELQAGPGRSELWCQAPQPGKATATRRWPWLRSVWLTAVAAVRGSGPRSAGGC